MKLTTANLHNFIVMMINLAGTVLFFTCILSTVQNKASDQVPQLQVKSLNVPFNPCRTASQMTSSTKKRLTKLAFAVISVCGLKVASHVEQIWGVSKEAPLLVPKIRYLMCLGIRVVYGVLADKTGKLPQSLVVDKSKVFDTATRIYTAVLKDTSQSTELCVRRGSNADDSQRVCLAKEEVYRYITSYSVCMHAALENNIPAYSDVATYGIATLIKVSAKGGLFNSMNG